MPFGLKNAGAVYCRLVKRLLDQLKLEGRADAGIKLKAKKTALFEPEVEFLGHRVSKRGIAPGTRHLEMIENMEEPKSGKEVQSMIGFIQFFSNFVPRFAQLTSAMNALRNKRHLAPGDWNEECQQGMKIIKETFAKPGLLRRYPLAPDDPNAGKMPL